MALNVTNQKFRSFILIHSTEGFYLILYGIQFITISNLFNANPTYHAQVGSSQAPWLPYSVLLPFLPAYENEYF